MVTVVASSAALRKKRNLKKSLNFTVMVIGQSGSGRSTFINSLCDQLIVEPSSTVKLYSPEELSQPDRDLQLRKSTVELEDNEGGKINLNLIDTPGFGDSIDNEISFHHIKDYLKHQFDEILIEESKLKRNPRFRDGRIHVCLYFINPTGHGLKEMDVEIIRELGELVNIIPVISKADSLTVQELKLNKRLIVEDIEHYKLPVFDFNDELFNIDGLLDDESIELNKYLQKSLPFAVMGSNSTQTDSETGEVKRVRKYAWGTVDIMDNEISDFLTLKNTLLISHLNDFKDYTHEVLYENYRTKTLAENDNEAEMSLGNSNGGYSRNVSTAATAYSTTGGVDSIVNGNGHSSMNGGEYNVPQKANSPNLERSPMMQNYSMKEEQIRLEEERLKAFEERVQRDLMFKREEIEARERELADIERRLAQESLQDTTVN